MEKAVTRRAQLEVSVSGPAELIPSLAAADFLLSVGGRPITDLTVDSFCAPPGRSGAPGENISEPSQNPMRKHYLFYFDQTMMTPGGRRRSLEVAERLVDALVRGRGRGRIVSAGRQVTFYTDWTRDASELKAALRRVREDPGQRGTFAATEEFRVREVRRAVRTGGCALANLLAWNHRRDEIAAARRAIERLAAVLERFRNVGGSKSVLYFADTTRRNAGEHYLAVACPSSAGRDIPFALDATMDRLIAAASVVGTRFYPVQAEGLELPAVRRRHAEDSLASLGLETGGRAFLGATRVESMIRRIRQDADCTYLLSFDPAGLPQDRVLRVVLRTSRRKVRLATRGLLTIESDAERETRRLSSVLLDAAASDTTEMPLEVLPLGHAKRAFSSLVQAVLPENVAAISKTWEFGIVVSRGDAIEHHVSGRVEGIARAGPLVVETVAPLPEGSHQVVAVFRDPESDRLVSTRRTVTIEIDRDTDVSVVALRLLARTPGTFWRDGGLRPEGDRIHDPESHLPSASRVTVTGTVCRGADPGRVYLGRRTWRGLDPPRFPTDLELDLERERCILIQDVVPAEWISTGNVRFELTILADGGPVWEGAATFSRR